METSDSGGVGQQGKDNKTVYTQCIVNNITSSIEQSDVSVDKKDEKFNAQGTKEANAPEKIPDALGNMDTNDEKSEEFHLKNVDGVDNASNTWEDDGAGTYLQDQAGSYSK